MEHLDFAITELRDMKMQPALERALSRREILGAEREHACSSVPDPSPRSAPYQDMHIIR